MSCFHLVLGQVIEYESQALGLQAHVLRRHAVKQDAGSFVDSSTGLGGQDSWVPLLTLGVSVCLNIDTVAGR